MTAIALKDLRELATGDNPDVLMASKGQELDVLEVFVEGSFWDYLLRDKDKKYPQFCAKKHEVRIVKV